jgi:hypothetical protein
MRSRPVALALLVALAPVTLTGPSFAQSAAEDPTTAMARARFKEGVDFYDKGEFEQARAAFLQAYALKKHPAVLLNLAWSCLKSGHALEAERYFKQFLVEGKDITDKQRSDASDGLAQTHAKLGRIEVVAPAGTEVTIDGEKVGTAPLGEPVSVEAGAHTVKLHTTDGTTDTESVSVLGGEKATARFSRPAGAPPAAAAAPPPTSAPPPPPPESEPAAPPATAEPPAEPAPEPAQKEPAPAHAGKSFVPDNMAPVYVGGVLTLAGAGVAIGMLVAKGQAQNRADSTAALIRSNAGQHASCSPPTYDASVVAHPTTTQQQNLSAACAAFTSDNNDVDTDALIGNIAVGVGAAALVGTIIYWIASDKREDTEHTAKATTVVTPVIGPSTGGLSISGTF